MAQDRTIEGLEYARGRVATAKKMFAECRTLRETVYKLGRDAATKHAADARCRWWQNEMMEWEEQVRLEQEQAPEPQLMGPPLIGQRRLVVASVQRMEREGRTEAALTLMKLLVRRMNAGAVANTDAEWAVAARWVVAAERKQRLAA